MDDFLKSYLERLKIESSKRAGEIVAGKCSSFEDYKAKCAYLQALQDSETWLRGAINKTIRPEDEPRLKRATPLRGGAVYD